ncbi:MAG: helix-turn-helix transcriptional regulator [Caulobacter sp.]
MDENSDVERSPNPIDVHVGARIRLRRRSLGISQERLAEDLGLTFQQVQKYERGANRVSASKLYEIARSLQISVTFFFDDLADPLEGRDAGFAEDAANPFANTFLMTPEGLELAELFPKIRRPRVRRRILELVRSMADEEDDELLA